MAFPTIPTTAANTLLSSTTSPASTTHTFPSLTTLAPQAGDLIIAICVAYEGDTTPQFSSWGASLVEIRDDSTTGTGNGALGVAYKIATGSETGTFSVTSVESWKSVNILMRIPASTWNGVTIPEITAATRAAGAAANPASFNPTNWDAEDTLWIAVGAHTETSTTGSPPTLDAAPTNYTGALIVARVADAVGDITAGVAFRQLNASSEDVGTWTTSNPTRGNGLAAVIAVRPKASVGFEGIASGEAFGTLGRLRRVARPRGALVDSAGGYEPGFVSAGSGVTIATSGSGSVSISGVRPGALIALQVLDPMTNGGSNTAISGVEALDGTDSSLTYWTGIEVGSPHAYTQWVELGRATSTTVTVDRTAGSGGPSVVRLYQFEHTAQGLLADIIEQGDNYSWYGGQAQGTGTTISDAGVQTNGPNRLAFNFVAQAANTTFAAFTGETGGDWSEAVAEYASASGTIGLQIASMPTAGTVDGGTLTAANAAWGVLGGALRPALVGDALVGGLPAQTVRPGGFGIEELLWRNPDFEQDLGVSSLDVNQQVAWEFQNGASVAISTANPRSGRRHMRVTTNGAGIREGAIVGLNDLYSDSPRVVAGRRYIFSAWVYVASGVDMEAKVAFKDINSNYLGTEWRTTFTGDGTWKFVSVADVAPAGALSAHPIIRTDEVIATTFDVDNVSMRPDVYATEVLKDSPRAWYRMHEGSGQPQDSSGNGNHTTATGGTPDYMQEGGLGSAVYFDGSTESFSAPDHASLDLGDVFTLEAWSRRGRTGLIEETILVKYDQGYGMFWKNNELMLAKSNVAVIVQSTIQITDTNWHHVVATKNGATVKLYIDGVDVTGTVTNATCADNNNALYIAVESTGSYFQGYLDEVAVYPTALSAERVKQHYNAGLLAGKDHGTADTNRVLRVSGIADFPSTPLLDDFNRADENPIGNGTWTTPMVPGNALAQIVNNKFVTANSPPAGPAAYWGSADAVEQETGFDAGDLTSEGFTSITGSPDADTTQKYRGTHSYHSNPTAAPAWARYRYVTPPSTASGRLYFRIEDWSADWYATLLNVANPPQSVNNSFVVEDTGGQLEIFPTYAYGTYDLTRVEIDRGVWYRLEWKLDWSATGAKTTWGIAVGEETLSVINTDATGGNTYAATTVDYVDLGLNTISSLAEINLDCVKLSRTGADYPLGRVDDNLIGPDCEVWARIAADFETDEELVLFARLTPGRGHSGYECAIHNNGTIFLGKRVGGAWNDSGLTANVSPAVGDYLGLRCVGSTIEAWYRAGGGAWERKITWTDTSFPNAGRLALQVVTQDSDTAVDDFGGGNMLTGMGRPDTNRVLRPRPWAFYDGFEANNLNLWTIAAGSPSIVTSPVYAGTYAVRANPTAGIVSLLRSMPAANAKATLSFRVRRASAAGETPILGTIGQNVGNPMILTQYNSGNLVLRWRDSGGTDHDLDSLTMPLDTWMHVELAVDASANPWKIRWRVDGVDRGEFTASHAAVNFDQWGVGCWGYAMTWDVYYDEVFAGLTYDYYANDMAPSMYRSGAPFADVMLEYGPASYWKLDESSGTTAVDRKGVADGTYSGPGYTLGQASLVPVDSGKSVLLDGSQGASVLLGDVYDFTGSAQFTACAWVRLGAFSVANGHFVFGNIDATARGWSLDLQTPAITIAARRGDNAGWDQAYYQVSEEFLEGSTHFLAAVYDGSNIKLFLDGSFVHSQPTSKSLVAPTTNTGLRIGSYGGGGSGWDGQLDEAAIFTYALSEAQLRAIYEAGVGAGAHKTSRVLRPEGFVHFPSTGLLDTFDRADAAGSLGSRWSSPFEPTFGSLGILSNKCYPATGFKDNYWTGAFDADQEVHVTLSTLPSAVGPIRIYARQQNHNGGSRNAYYIETQYDGAGWIGKVVAGAASGLGSGWGAGSVAAGDKIALRCIGTRITAYKFSGGAWSVLESLTDSSVTGSGTIGLQVRDDTTARFDDFGGGSVGAGAVGWHALSGGGTPPEFDGTLRVVGNIASAEAFGAHRARYILQSAGAIVTAEAHGQPDTNRVLRALGVSSQEAWGQGYLKRILRAAGIATSETFGQTDTNRVLRPQGLATAEAFGLPDGRFVIKNAGSIATAEAFGSQKLRRIIRTLGVATAEAFGSPWIPRLYVMGIATSEAFGVPRLRLIVRPIGATSGEAFGNFDWLRFVFSIRAIGDIASGEAFGQADKIIRQVRGLGAASGEAFGTTRPRFVVRTAGAASLEGFGDPNTRGVFSLRAVGDIASGEIVATPELERVLRAAGVASAEAFGQDRLRRLIGPTGAPSVETFGTTDVNRMIRALGAASTEAWGQPTMAAYARQLYAQAIASAEVFGEPKLLRRIGVIGITTGEAFGIAMLGGDEVLIKPSVPGEMLLSETVTWELVMSDGELYLIGVDDVPAFDILLDDMPGG